ncbi:MFS transporter [Actinophytocola xinjiangensis]|uniref:MFS transporter n=1 Tax=Actinophytocola xinjiangensis TaxID=485602 RepID=A0A7Z0WQ93_9PSEU|nr:MFS transporter [Actinophytocola xinjiangensis]OLF12959.1 MFS transporter [Actinophytocola xinjiangensis]
MTVNELLPGAGRRPWAGLAVLCLANLVIAVDIFVLMLAVPHIGTDLATSATETLWIFDIHGFMVGAFLITMGGLGDRIGRRRLFLIGSAAVGLASVVCAYAPNPEVLIAGRVLLGIAVATLPPCSLGLIRTMFPEPRRMGVAIGFWAGSFTVGAIVGPVLGGALLDQFWWGSVFLIAVPILLVVLVAGPASLPEHRNPDAARLDLTSAALSLATILPIIFGIKEVAHDGWGLTPVAALVVGLALGVVFVRRQRRVTNPLMDLSLFRNRAYSIGLGSLLTYAMLTGATLMFVTMHFQMVAGLSALESGLALVPGMALSTLSVTLAPVLARWVRPAYLIGAGLVVVVLGLFLVTRVEPTSGPAVLITSFAVWCVGSGFVLAMGISLVVGSVPVEKAASASSMPQISNEFGASLGIATLGVVGTLIYRAQVELPAAVPAEAAVAAGDSLVGALTVAGTLPPEVAGPLVGAAFQAFNSGLQTVATTAAIILAGLAVLVVVKLRHIPPLARQDAAPEPESTEDSGTGAGLAAAA